MGRPTGPVVGRRAARAALPVLALALGLLAPGQSAAQGTLLPARELVPLAEAYSAAWNARDLPAVLALFAPDAVVRERRGDVPPAVWDTRDPQVVRTYLDGALNGDHYDTGGLVWAMGHRQIAAWAAARFAQHHRYAVGPPRPAGDTVGWPYREYADPFQFVRGFSPTEGDAEAVVRFGRITVLTLVESPASAQRRWREVGAVLERPVANRHATPLGDGPSSALSGSLRGGPAAEPTPVGWPLALGGLAGLAAVTAALRRRRLP